jgi:hypothetical protein
VFDKTGLKVIMDSAFCASEFECITKSAHYFGAIQFNAMEQMAIELAATSMQQAAEWGSEPFRDHFLNCLTHFHSKMVLENDLKHCQ